MWVGTAGTVHDVSNVGIATEQISNILHVHGTVQYFLKKKSPKTSKSCS